MSRKILLIDSSYPINTRNSKILRSLKQVYPDFDIEIVTWNRENKTIPIENNSYVYNKFSPGGLLFRKLWNLKGYYFFIRNINRKIRPDILIASHWDMLLLCVLCRMKKQILIYEDLDIPTASFKLFLYVILKIEQICLKYVDIIIFASRFYLPLYNNAHCTKIILENKPDACGTKKKDSFTRASKVVSYIGGVRYIEILKNLVDAVKDNKAISLNIHGDGHDLVALKEYASEYSNVCFTGYYKQKDIVGLYQKSDLVWAAYPNLDYNVKYAISNKFHESLHYGVPCVFSEKTKLGELVQKEQIGLVVNPYNVLAIKNLLNEFFEHPAYADKIRNTIYQYGAKEVTWEKEFESVKVAIDSYLAKNKCI